LFLSVCGACGFFAYAWLRGERRAEAGVIAMLLVGSVVGPTTTHLRQLTEPNGFPLAALCVLQMVLAWRRGSSLRFFSAMLAAAVVMGLVLSAPDQRPIRYVLPVHLVLLGAAVCGLYFTDRAATFFRRLSAVSFPPLSVFTLWSWQSSGIGVGLLLAYLVTMTGLPLGLWYVTRDRWFLGAGATNLAGGSFGLIGLGFRTLKLQYGARIVIPLSYGVAFFLIAILISAHKAGAFRGMFRRRKGTEEVGVRG
jgi:hypothetical protein